MRLKALAEIYAMHSFAPFSYLDFVKKIAKLANFARIFANFAIIFTKF